MPNAFISGYNNQNQPIYVNKSISCYGVIYRENQQNHSLEVLIGEKGWYGYNSIIVQNQPPGTERLEIFTIKNNPNQWVYPGGSVEARRQNGQLYHPLRNYTLQNQIYRIVQQELQEELEHNIGTLAANQARCTVSLFQTNPIQRFTGNNLNLNGNNNTIDIHSYFGVVYLRDDNFTQQTVNNINNPLLANSITHLNQFVANNTPALGQRPNNTVKTLEERRIQFVEPGVAGQNPPAAGTALALMPNNQTQDWFHAITNDFIWRANLPPGHADRLP